MSRITQTYQRTLSGSIGSGLGSVFGGSGKQYYILEHKISSRYHKAGETQEIIVNEIEMGRGEGCQVRFDESFSTVSRRHAAIVKEGDKWKLIQLSNTNPTLLNGNEVNREWYLQNGDEIQLAIGGPRLGFIIPAGKTMGSIGLTRRLNLFANQALRPYKWAIALLGIALILAIGGLSTWKYLSDKKAKEKIAIIEAAAKAREAEAKAQYKKFQAEQDSIANALKNTKTELSDATERLQKAQDDLKRSFQTNPTPPINDHQVSIGSVKTDNKAIETCLPYVYFVYTSAVDIIYPNGNRESFEDFNITGTGFLLDDGRFITARHVIEPWFFVRSETDSIRYAMNIIANNGGKIIVYFNALSSSGDRFSFTNEQMVCNRSHDSSGVTDDGYRYVIGRLDNTDWAYCKTNRPNGLTANKAQSTTLERGTELTILGFPFGLGANSANDINPVLSKATTSMPGLNSGVILTTSTTFEPGNSGGPVFYTDSSGKLIVIGIVSAGAGRSTGSIVPIASVY
ncbi:MAG: FHA domain-containing protein [Candidatus Azobacteroides sp.]|nr:FHA domain-containing protein [Candidatus Azobacteroides sp.]